MISIIRLYVLLFVGGLSFLVNATEVVGLTPGEFRVDESGAATYSIPINTPAGTAGVTPQVSLAYSSNNLAEGPAGVGWSISGLSSISRCPQTPIHDGGNIQEVQYNSTDKFCLDGQRLILKSGTYGAANSTYRTEVDNFSTITAKLGSSTNGPQYFEIKNKAGETHYYGDISTVNSAYGDASDAFVEPGGFSSGVLARSWALKAIKDVKDNFILFDYSKNTTEGTFYIDSIHYTGNLTTGAPLYAEIDFIYQDYDKGFKGYMSGAYLNHNKILERIDTKIDNSTYRSYFLNYENSAFIEERTLLTSVQECNDTFKSSCFPATTFDWQRPALSTSSMDWVCKTEPGVEDFCHWQPNSTVYQPFPTVDTYLTGSTSNVSTSQVFDINGDGYQDLVYVSGSYWYTKLGPYFTSAKKLSGVGDNKKEYALNIDYNGDGVRDLLIADSKTSNWYVISYQPNVTVKSLGVVATGLEGEAQVMDVNGDGMEDIVFRTGNYLKAHINDRDGTFTANHLLYTFSSTPSSVSLNSGYESQTASMKSASGFDVNGDGKSDLIIKVTTTTGGCYVSGRLYPFVRSSRECQFDWGGNWSTSSNTEYKLFKSSGTTNSPELSLLQTLGSASYMNTLRVADFNGDGLNDLTYVANDKWYYRLSDGTELLSPREAGLVTSSTKKLLNQFIDLNGDGRTDVLHATSTSNWYVYFSRPTNDAQWLHFESRGTRSFDNNATIRFGDTNGDGKIDLLTSTGSTWKEYTNRKNIKEYVISTVTNGHGVETNVTYKPMTDSSVYVFQSSDEDTNSDTFSPVSGAQLVSRVTTDSNTGSSVAVSYQYGGMLIHKKGRGSLGFQMLRTIDEQSGVISETQYNQSHDSVNFSKARMPIYSEQRLNGKLLSSASNILSVRSTVQGAVLPYISESIEKSYVYGSDGISTQINETVTTNHYDGWGNLTYNTVLITDSGTYKAIETITDNDFGTAAQQQLGRLQSTRVSKRRTGDAAYSVRKTSFSYNSDNMLSGSIVSPDASATKLTTSYGYDSYGNKKSVSVTGYSTATGSSQTRTSLTDYQRYGRFVNYKQNALSERVTYKYNGASAASAYGLTTSLTQTDANSISTTTYYDAMGQVSSINHPDSRTTTITNNFCMNCIGNSYYKTVKKVTGSPDKEAYYDKWGRQVASRVKGFNGSWILTQTEYDSQGRQYKSYEPNTTSFYTQLSYDVLGRVDQITKPNNSFITQEIYGLESRTTNELGKLSKTFSNGFGETASTQDALGNTVTFIYDAFGNLLESKTTAEGKDSIVEAKYDTWGRKTKTIDPIKGTWNYTYNAFGELYTQTTAENQKFTFSYDVLGRKTRSYEASEGTLCWNYGSIGYESKKAVGKIVSTAKYEGSNVACNTSSTASIEKAFIYDYLGRTQDVITTINSKNYTQSQSYDSYSRPYVTTYPAGTSSFAIKNVYNSYGYLTEQRNNATNALYKRIDSMSDRGQVEQVTLGNGVSTINDYYNDTGWAHTVSVKKGGSWLNDISVTYDLIGNVTSRGSNYAASGLIGSNYNEYYYYDDLNRIESRTISIKSGSTGLPSSFKSSQTYTFDDWGNFTFKTGAGYYKYDSSKVHKLLGVYSNSNFTGTLYSFSYDNNGNIKSDGNRSFTYGSFDKPIYISNGSASSSMKYGVSRELYYKQDSYQENGTNVTYKTTYLGNYEKVERSGGKGSLTEHKYYVGDIIVTQRSNSSTDTYYLHKDHQGSVVATTNKNGTVISQAIYDPYGKRTGVYLESVLSNFTYSEPTDRGYTGHKHISALNIIHMNGRIYDPTLGRFLQADPNIQAPRNSQSFNRYSYVLNNPLSYTDPSGYFFKKLGKFVKKYWRAIAAVVIAVYAPYLLEAYWGITNAVASGAITGFLSGGVATGSLKGAVIGAFTGAMFGQLHSMKAGIGKVIAHGVAGGISSVLNGGKFGHGFAAAGFTQAMSGGGKVFVKGDRIGNAVKAAVIGGTASTITGGKFANGAVTGAFSRLLNDDFGSYKDEQKELKYKENLIGGDIEITKENAVGITKSTSIISGQETESTALAIEGTPISIGVSKDSQGNITRDVQLSKTLGTDKTGVTPSVALGSDGKATAQVQAEYQNTGVQAKAHVDLGAVAHNQQTFLQKFYRSLTNCNGVCAY